MIIRVADFETTGFPEEGKASAIIQAGWTDVEWTEGEKANVLNYPTQFFCNPFRVNPALEMDIGAQAVHHIDKSDLVDAPSLDEVMRKLVAGADAFACHNKEHDGHYFTGAGKPFVCTLKAAKRVWPDMERHGNQYLRYALKLPVEREIADPAHWAGPDSYVTAFLLAAILNEGATLADMIEWGAEPNILQVLRFGNKHRDKRFEDVPTDYLQWMNDKATDLDRDLKFTVRHHLDLRGAL